MFLPAFIILCLTYSIEGTRIDIRIQNGENTEWFEIPYVVSLQNMEDHFCGGAILNENYVLTAAHCIDNSMIDLRPERINVTTGHNRSNPISIHSVTWLYSHENYVGIYAYLNDIAILKVTPPFVLNGLVAPVTLPPPYFEVFLGTKALLAGWGHTVTKKYRTRWTKPTILQKLSILVGSQNYCKEQYMPKLYNIFITHLCTMIPIGKPQSACMGDSGSPLIIKYGDKNMVVGIASISPQDDYHCSTYPTVYTKVSHYIDWISEHTTGLVNNQKKSAMSRQYEYNDRIVFPNY